MKQVSAPRPRSKPKTRAWPEVSGAILTSSFDHTDLYTFSQSYEFRGTKSIIFCNMFLLENIQNSKLQNMFQCLIVMFAVDFLILEWPPASRHTTSLRWAPPEYFCLQNMIKPQNTENLVMPLLLIFGIYIFFTSYLKILVSFHFEFDVVFGSNKKPRTPFVSIVALPYFPRFALLMSFFSPRDTLRLINQSWTLPFFDIYFPGFVQTPRVPWIAKIFNYNSRT